MYVKRCVSISEVLVALSSDSQPDLVHESRRLQGVSRFFVGHSHHRQFAQLFIDQRQ